MMPHAEQTVEELSVVSDLSNWGNCNVQFIGKLFDSAGDSGVYTCVGIESIKSKKATSEKTKEIIVDFSLAADIPPRNVLVRIWGELELKMFNSLMSPYVRAKVCKGDVPIKSSVNTVTLI